MLELKNICKSYKKQEVLRNVNMNLAEGMVYGFTGENGSGKTVLMKIIIGLCKPDKGSIIYNGEKLKEKFDYLPSVGFVIEYPEFYSDLSAFENLKILASIKKVISDNQIVEWITKVGLPNDKKPVEEFSLGMKQRLGIAQALMEDPEVIILDEITNSLDTQGVDLVYRLIEEEKRKGKIIILSSHSKYDIENLCDEIFVFKNGDVSHED